MKPYDATRRNRMHEHANPIYMITRCFSFSCCLWGAALLSGSCPLSSSAHTACTHKFSWPKIRPLYDGCALYETVRFERGPMNSLAIHLISDMVYVCMPGRGGGGVLQRCVRLHICALYASTFSRHCRRHAQSQRPSAICVCHVDATHTHTHTPCITCVYTDAKILCNVHKVFIITAAQSAGTN